MSFKMQRVHVFHAEVEDEPGGISGKLKKLAEAGAHLEYVYSQRSAEKQGVGDLYVAPLHGVNELALVPPGRPRRMPRDAAFVVTSGATGAFESER